MSGSSGAFGGEVAALKLNVDFSDAGLLTGTVKVKFGDLTLCSLTTLSALNGTSVRSLLATVNTALGGGSTPYSIGDLDALTANVNAAFSRGTPSTFAQLSLRNGACP